MAAAVKSVRRSVAFALLCPEWKLASRRLKLMIQGARKKGREGGSEQEQEDPQEWTGEQQFLRNHSV